jgi:hypothetical protein
MDRHQHVVIGAGRWGGFHMRDHMGRRGVTRLGRMRLVADPGQAPLDAVTRLQIIRGMDKPSSRWDVAVAPPARGILGTIVLLYPDLAEHLHRRRCSHLRGGLGRIGSVEEGKPISADDGCELLPCSVRLGKSIVLDPRRVALRPFRLHMQGSRRRGGSTQSAWFRPRVLGD